MWKFCLSSEMFTHIYNHLYNKIFDNLVLTVSWFKNQTGCHSECCPHLCYFYIHNFWTLGFLDLLKLLAAIAIVMLLLIVTPDRERKSRAITDIKISWIKVLRNGKILLGTKKRMLDCCVISLLLYGSECLTISQRMGEKLEVAKMHFCRRIPNILWMEQISNKEVLTKWQQKIYSPNQEEIAEIPLMRKKGMENLNLIRYIEGKRDRGRQWATNLMGFGEGVVESLAKSHMR